jgi:hypothetical protein
VSEEKRGSADTRTQKRHSVNAVFQHPRRDFAN